MRIALSCSLVLLATLAVFPAQALEPLVLYDDFNGERIDPEKWSGDESGRLLEVAREIRGNRLRLAARAFGSTTSDTGRSSSRLRLEFSDPAAVTAIEAKVRVREVGATGCPGNSTPTRASVRINGFFFNTATPTPGSNLNDVQAIVRIERLSNSTDPEDVLRVVGRVVSCNDAGCGTDTVLSSADLGPIEKGERARLRIQWDPDNDQFIFQRDKEEEVFAPYTVSDTAPPGFPAKRLDLALDVANCTAPGAAAFMEARFEDVFVNQPAAP